LKLDSPPAFFPVDDLICPQDVEDIMANPNKKRKIELEIAQKVNINAWNIHLVCSPANLPGFKIT